MKDAYSFHRNAASLDDYYRAMHEAYARIFKRCGLTFRAVLADPGLMGGRETHEFMVLAETGESVVISCPAESCGYAATTDTAAGVAPPAAQPAETPLREVDTPGKRTVEEVAAFLGVAADRLIKTLLYRAGGETVAVLVRGDRDVSEPKLRRALGRAVVELAGEETVRGITGAETGFAGPVGLAGVRILADRTVQGMRDAVTGANKNDRHLAGVSEKRDFSVEGFFDLAVSREGDGCPRCGAALTAYRGIEVGQIFKLGTKYSETMGATFTDEDGAAKPFVMGCYGIGITRTVAAAIEQHHDKDGIVWPMALAPYQVEIIAMKPSDEAVMRAACTLADLLAAKGVEVVLDDRDERPGVKFKDADLVGIPLRVVVGPKGLSQRKIELKWRGDTEARLVDAEGAADEIAKLVLARMEAGD